MRILIIISDMFGGGAQRVVSRLANSLVEDNDVLITTFKTQRMYPLDSKVKLHLFKAPEIPHYSRLGFIGNVLFAYRRMLALRRQLLVVKKKERPDVTLSFLNNPNLLNAITGGGGLKIMSERNNPRQRGCLYFLKAVFSFFHADKVVFQTNTVKNMFPWLIRRKGVVIPNPVRVECHASGNSHKIVTMGRLHPQKNHELLINAFAIFAEKHPSHTLHIYGKDYGGVGLVSLIRQNNLIGKVFLEGFLDNVHEAIADAEQFVLSSNHEGTPNALLEAMMMGIPCISTDFVGVREMLGDNDACVLTPLGDEMALAKAMESFADDETLRSKYVRNGCLLAERYSFEKVIPQWKDLLNASL